MIRSKGVGVYFVTKDPSDIPIAILGQLGNRVLHALRIYTPKQQVAVNAMLQLPSANSHKDFREAITTLEDGQALVSFLDENGVPERIERTTILPPQSSMKRLTHEQWMEAIRLSRFQTT